MGMTPALEGEAAIAMLGELFVTEYLVPFELMALLLLVALAGAVMLARDRGTHEQQIDR